MGCGAPPPAPPGDPPQVNPAEDGGRDARSRATGRYLAFLDGGKAGGLDARGVVEHAHVTQHHHRAEQQGRGVGHVLARDVRGRPVDLPGTAAPSGPPRGDPEQRLPRLIRQRPRNNAAQKARARRTFFLIAKLGTDHLYQLLLKYFN